VYADTESAWLKPAKGARRLGGSTFIAPTDCANVSTCRTDEYRRVRPAERTLRRRVSGPEKGGRRVTAKTGASLQSVPSGHENAAERCRVLVRPFTCNDAAGGVVAPPFWVACCYLSGMPTLVVGMLVSPGQTHMPTTSVGMPPRPQVLRELLGIRTPHGTTSPRDARAFLSRYHLSLQPRRRAHMHKSKSRASQDRTQAIGTKCPPCLLGPPANR
jgi:hypothetical protein